MLKEKYQEKNVSKVSQFTLCSLVHIFLDSVTNFAILDLQKMDMYSMSASGTRSLVFTDNVTAYRSNRMSD